MDQIALISDLHGNLPALETTLADISRRGIDTIYCLGDLVGKGPHSEQTVDICRQVCAKTVKGNWDDFIVAETDKPTLQWHRQRLGPERLAYLKRLPTTIEFVMSGKNIRLFHASPISVYHRVRMNDPIDAHLAMFNNTEFTGDAMQPDVVGYGDIHAAYLKCFQHRILFNVGSVGNPLDLAQAAYAIVEGVYDSPTPGPFAVQIIRLPYDIEAAIQQAADEGMPELDLYANELRTARYRGLSSPPPSQVIHAN
jgi:protein phosphatase